MEVVIVPGETKKGLVPAPVRDKDCHAKANEAES